MIWMDTVLVSPSDRSMFGERILRGHRVWDPYRSKLAALAYLGHGVDLPPSLRVLYLGAAHGTTVSHIADYVECVYAVEMAPRPMEDLLSLARLYGNIVPVMGDATRPAEYAPLLEPVGLLYLDVASPRQAEIACAHRIFLEEGGLLVLMVKTRSIDSTADPDEVTRRVIAEISPFFLVKAVVPLDPYHRDHRALLCEAERGGPGGA
ncbi:MAG: fibrillarin-like rRNA/tRNA 2'-O-methyltransferase [Methanomicrobiales archaeon]|nr:fibrillarin-like rRNA/tRNA 2'-O-methyltransferase [Methanomicrobiales archaeon]